MTEQLFNAIIAIGTLPSDTTKVYELLASSIVFFLSSLAHTEARVTNSGDL